MSTTFSIVINFSMLSLLRRLHQLHIQTCLEAESEQTKIKYPRVEAHKNKDGHHNPNICDLLPDGKQIAEAVERGRELILLVWLKSSRRAIAGRIHPSQC